ncbi:hypothetical protein [Chromobacterium haemolyticum]|uniref:hypothetical protein n=1 Tax=Chromobacterium haemolyticum TaxID=394935 RepID=UPI0005BD73AC|nr:hypothetical protein [Chromobacterium haemolyticum]
MALDEIANQITDDEFALDTIQGERVIITSPIILGTAGSEWEGSPIFRRDYLLALLSHSIRHKVLNAADIDAALGLSAARDAACQACG